MKSRNIRAIITGLHDFGTVLTVGWNENVMSYSLNVPNICGIDHV